ncbi:hypothetical protein FRC0290_02388 [Corynebacterium diphtheriae]|nr:transposase-like protein [Corynebacterium diphtheriae str. Aberdeen]ERA55204.1 transposase-like protein [Corynebacterium diphtheriae DSM 43988]ONF70093.1 transposase [Corynebacterium diphtheriae]CAB0828677.1 hypothetical protein FRC0290_02388 [Corynebacterium diphtheriae]CAB1026590.1 hypothetical protein FRC0534_02402 [Corynebacterium diphtheriae]
MLRWMPTLATSLATGVLKLLLGQTITVTGRIQRYVDSHYGPVTVDVPRDRAGTFLPTMVPKGSRRLTDVDDMIVSLYAGGMTI